VPAPSPLPPDVRRRIEAVHGAPGAAWVATLPAAIEAWRARWSLGSLSPLPPNYAWVGAGRRADGTPCVLKLAPPDAGVLGPEARWLELVAGDGAARLLESAPTEGALLLQWVRPGTPLATLSPTRDDEACDALAATIARIRRPAGPDTGLPTLTDRLAELHEHVARHHGTDPLPGGIAATAARVADELLRTAGADELLHGDLHHDNVVLDRDGGWLAIDPHGLRGDPGYEVGAALYNPLPLGPLVAGLAERRARRLAAGTGFPEERVRSWGFVQAVLSAVWSLDEDPEPDRHVLDVADRLAP
jgi:streptomycin 6-kinase